MKKWFVVVMNILLGCMVAVIWMSNEFHGNSRPVTDLTLVTVLLLIICWGTPLLIFKPWVKKKNNS